ncbi:ABC transporter substrate-binding protein [Pseudarthrobacter sp. J75]|uniref:ABC transporter substrate-binding protein n=1 Tax=unclassified Pseudarthrobacter TaxID=2647000 RepID=UPI002E81AAB5|nr:MULTISPECIES: ABC transporter substrate-binding protein [unclassified Pseudarthrobacter]MEE2521357.1 ABC transporter substrate-binding protein [Pseudarthrobacter sp. J47]MEE2528589.1 ABC transporter substrate-binding protein [Pseudarthrobacter sp. J75]MEE2568280.1 ABC transporter substrate-binding protein [Pseudarthrobacter sp. J64]
MTKHKKSLYGAIALAGVSALAVTACTGPSGGGGTSTEGAGSTITYGTTDKVVTLDPAGSYDGGSFMVMNQIYPFLMNYAPGTADATPDIAESASFTSPTEYTVKLKSDLKFANGNTLDSSDVVFSFNRVVAINDPNGPASLLSNMEKVEATDPTTVVFTLKAADDQVFPGVLASNPGPIVDEEVFPADKIMDDDAIIEAKPFAGQYTIDSYQKNELVSFKPNSEYKGMLGAAENGGATLKHYADPNNLKLDVQQGNIDVAGRILTATDVADLEKDSKVKVHKGPGGELRYMVFNFDTMPFGAKTPEADPAKALAVRQAVAHLVDRDVIASQVFKDTYTPVYSYVPQGFEGATEPLKSLYGDGNGKPSLDKAKKVLSDAGVSSVVDLKLQYTDRYGTSAADEYALVKEQLEKSGLFTVDLKSTEWTTYTKERRADAYPVYQLGWFPDYSDADNYLTPFFIPGNFLGNHYENPEVTEVINKQLVTTDKAERATLIGEAQEAVAEDLSTLPLLQGAQVMVAGTDVKGVEKTLDASFKTRLGVMSK